MAEKLTPFTFQSTGVEVNIRPVSPMLAQRARQSVIRPIPPMERIENPDGTFRDEPNTSHPSFAEAMIAYNAEVEKVTRGTYIEEGVVLTLSDEQRAELKTLRDRMSKKGVMLEEDDVVAYITNRAIGSLKDYVAFIEVVSGESQPTGPK